MDIKLFDIAICGFMNLWARRPINAKVFDKHKDSPTPDA